MACAAGLGLALASPAQAGTVAESDGPSEPIDSGHIEQLVVELSFANTALDCSDDVLDEAYFFSETGRSSAQYWAHQSRGAVSIGGDTVEVTLPSEAYFGDFVSHKIEWAEQAEWTLQEAGLDTTAYDLVSLILPTGLGQTHAGLAQLGGRYSWISGCANATSASVTVVHETGHNLGLHHASRLKDNQLIEYGGASVMGNSWWALTAPARLSMGWYEDDELATASRPGRYAVSVLDGNDSSAPQILAVRRASANPLLISTRGPVGTYDAALPEALVGTLHLHQGHGVQTGHSLRLADLAPGETWFDPMDQLTLDNVSFDGRVLEFDLSFPTDCVPQPATLIATDDLVQIGQDPVSLTLLVQNKDSEAFCEGNTLFAITHTAEPGLIVDIPEGVSVPPEGNAWLPVWLSAETGTEDGLYTVDLDASRDDGGPDSATRTVTVRVDRTPPPPPFDLSATLENSGSVTLTWQFDFWSDTTTEEHHVYRNGVLVASTEVFETWVDPAPPSGEVQYTVTSLDGLGNESARSGPVVVLIGD